eukprot:m.63200 g.63200  ORF g.63200 m.63200 type:complete len:520 (-) comp13431_c0_seq2:65-1624(-)
MPHTSRNTGSTAPTVLPASLLSVIEAQATRLAVSQYNIRRWCLEAIQGGLRGLGTESHPATVIKLLKALLPCIEAGGPVTACLVDGGCSLASRAATQQASERLCLWYRAHHITGGQQLYDYMATAFQHFDEYWTEQGDEAIREQTGLVDLEEDIDSASASADGTARDDGEGRSGSGGGGLAAPTGTGTLSGSGGGADKSGVCAADNTAGNGSTTSCTTSSTPPVQAVAPHVPSPPSQKRRGSQIKRASSALAGGDAVTTTATATTPSGSCAAAPPPPSGTLNVSAIAQGCGRPPRSTSVATTAASMQSSSATHRALSGGGKGESDGGSDAWVVLAKGPDYERSVPILERQRKEQGLPPPPQSGSVTDDSVLGGLMAALKSQPLPTQQTAAAAAAPKSTATVPAWEQADPRFGGFASPLDTQDDDDSVWWQQRYSGVPSAATDLEEREGLSEASDSDQDQDQDDDGYPPVGTMSLADKTYASTGEEDTDHDVQKTTSSYLRRPILKKQTNKPKPKRGASK